MAQALCPPSKFVGASPAVTLKFKDSTGLLILGPTTLPLTPQNLTSFKKLKTKQNKT